MIRKRNEAYWLNYEQKQLLIIEKIKLSQKIKTKNKNNNNNNN